MTPTATSDRTRLRLTILGILSLALVAIADYLTGTDVVFNLLYAGPVILLTKARGRWGGVFAGIAGALLSLGTQVLWTNGVVDSPLLSGFNTMVRGGMLVLVAVLFANLQDLNENLAAEVGKQTAALRENEKRYRDMFDLASEGIFTLSLELQLLEVNEAFARMHGYRKEEMNGMHLKDVDTPETTERVPERMRRLLAGEVLHFEVKHHHKDGHDFAMDVSASLISSGDKHVILCFHRDISERKRAEAAAEEARWLLTETGRIGKVGGWEFNIDTMRQVWTEEVYHIHEVDPSFQPTVEAGINFYTPESRPIVAEALQRTITRGEPFDLELEIVTARGNRRAVHAIGGMDQPNRRVVGFFQDITTHKQAEDGLRRLMEEKEALLKEVHHRVKNNLQVITSMLRLESARSKQPDTVSVLWEMQGRVRSMALLHEALYQSATFAAVDLGNYLQRLTTETVRAMRHEPDLVRLRLELASVHVKMEQAIPCGLLINELISNSLKHGFPDDRDGEIHVSLQRVDDGTRVRLQVSDTGVGLPADFAVRPTTSLGLQLVSDLARQLGGALEIGPGPAAVFSVTFLPEDVLLSPPPPPKAGLNERNHGAHD